MFPKNAAGAVRAWARRGQALQDKLNKLRVRSSSRNGELAVVVDIRGRVQEIRITPEALDGGAARLGQLLTETVQRAQADADTQLADAWRPVMSDPAVKGIIDFGQKLANPEAELQARANVEDLSFDEQVAHHQDWIQRQFRQR